MQTDYRIAMKNTCIRIALFGGILCCSIAAFTQERPNVILICADDLGYGDLSCYGATKLKTPHIDQLAARGIRFTHAHATSATCTPSRYALLTGTYPWRKEGVQILPGDAALLIPENKLTLPKLFRSAGYTTGIVGKWHLGLGNQIEKNWNEEIKPGPNETGFDYSFIFPATADRVPTVFLENHRVLGLDAQDTIRVSYTHKVGDEPTGKEHPELLKMQASPGQGHDQTIVNGIGRIGYMSGGKKARWTDEELTFTFLEKAADFISSHNTAPFFLYLAATEPHVPRMPATEFKGRSGLGYRGDAILQLDWLVGQVLAQVELAGVAEKTVIVLTSDNGPVLNDGYQDGAVAQLNGHTPWGPFRGGKYSAFEAGTRVPFLIRWPKQKQAIVSNALVSQMDLLASFAHLLQKPLPDIALTDSEDQLPALKGETKVGRKLLVEQGGPLALVAGNWKYISPAGGVAYDQLTGIETGRSALPQLYNLENDPGEQKNLAEIYPQKVKELQSLLESIIHKKDQ